MPRWEKLDRFPRINQKTLSLTIRFREAFMSRDWEAVRLDVREKAVRLGLLTARYIVVRAHGAVEPLFVQHGIFPKLV